MGAYQDRLRAAARALIRFVLMGIGRIFDQMAIVVGSAIVPPYRAAFAKRDLRLVDFRARGFFRSRITGSLGCTDRAPRIHQHIHVPLALALWQVRIARAP